MNRRSALGGALQHHVAVAYARIAAADRPEIFISLRPEAEVQAEISRQIARVEAGERLPLAGLLFAVKDNIDVAGLATTAGCPAFAFSPAADATVVARLRAAGAVVMGKTNLDQFATGLVGTRSPYGAVRSAVHPDRISGGSSSGSAVAVALGLVDFALGTDTAGSGRVPAALQGIVGLKASTGIVPTTGVVPACRSLDCPTVFSTSFDLASLVLDVMAGPDAADPFSRAFPEWAPLGAAQTPVVVAVPRAADLVALSELWRTAFDLAVSRLRDDPGYRVVEIDLTPFLEAARLLYDGAFVAERYTAVGAFVEAHPGETDEIVASIIRGAGDLPAHRLAGDIETLRGLRAEAQAAFGEADVLFLPTTTHHPTLAEVAAAPIAVNSRLGSFTNFCNLFGYPAAAIPIDSGEPAENVGAMVLAREFADRVAFDVARDLQAVVGVGVGAGAALRVTRGRELFVVGAHRSGMPANGRLTRLGAVSAGVRRTAPGYTLFDLEDALHRPGMVKDGGDSVVTGELWRVPETAIATLLAESRPPLGFGWVTLDDGAEVLGYLCEQQATVGKPVIASGDWKRRGA
ncbi:allophanate hydrolase [Subtercola endophyticus]|uniref:allophanate hydrolase n=1 Tax=Subtercola endophyticus TaxID=2895559 RepID=UPI001E58AC47|nr:allophanate hydrolase [Subtercola endophyticus]UFS58659.1 allophanate hydrolase [Subtercola endophyticus]